ncbi:DUF4367 domain-containing protein [uncultured Oscillibacter sp.]|uniref:DUF4367 domain-containing protein n=1 Tax=uncultured Oscillibacter sp. TaxID=876091 RepID=UPI002804B422|nr:DUF4367 domain-containing protein [uncultured Oscillibacter sp.]
MTDKELDSMMQQILLDAIALDEERCEDKIPFEPSLKYQHQTALMLKDPIRWEKNRSRPVWKKYGQRVAAILLVAFISLGSVMVASPTARAMVLQWFREWYETYISYHYTQEGSIPETMPEYTITALPEGYKENISERIEWPNYIQCRFENADESPILFDYIYMETGSISNIETEGAEIIEVVVNGCEGAIILPENSVKSDCTLTWINAEENLQFTIHASMDQNEILHIAESVKLIQ